MNSDNLLGQNALSPLHPLQGEGWGGGRNRVLFLLALLLAMLSSPAQAVLNGNLDAANCLKLSGWAWESTTPSSPLSVDIYDGSTLLTTAVADVYRPDLLAAGMGDGKHSFLIPTPAVLLDGNTHVVSVKYAGKTLALYTSPKSLTCQNSSTALSSSPALLLAGQALTLSATVTTSTGAPTGAVSFLEGNTLLGNANLVNGKASINTSLPATGGHTLQARYAGNGVYAGSVGTDASVVVNANPVSLSSNRLVFGNQTMNSASAAQTVTLNNGSSSNITFSAITMGGGNPGQFSLAAGTSCKAGLALPAGGSCTLSVQFTPTLNQNVGDKMAYLTLNHSAGSHLITLTGTTTLPAQTTASVNPASLTLTTPPQTPSVEGIFILSNTGSSPLMFYAGAASLQGVNASLFTLLPSSTCLSSAGVNVPVGQSCTLAVQFKPSAAVIPNTVYFASLILNLNTPSPLKIPLSGKVNNTPQVYYIHPDHLNTPRMITDVGGKVVWQWENTEPFGNNTPNQNPSGLGTFEYNPRFPGQYFDKETGLNYNGFRDYDPAIGRYIQSDPIGLRGGVNTFGYVGGSPLGASDPWGLCDCKVDAVLTGVGGKQAMADGALYSEYPKEAGGSIKGGTMGTVAVQRGFFGLTTRQLRLYGTQITVTLSDESLVQKYGGPTGALTVSDYGDTNIQNTNGIAFDIYRFPSIQDGRKFGRRQMEVTIHIPDELKVKCPK